MQQVINDGRRQIGQRVNARRDSFVSRADQQRRHRVQRVPLCRCVFNVAVITRPHPAQPVQLRDVVHAVLVRLHGHERRHEPDILLSTGVERRRLRRREQPVFEERHRQSICADEHRDGDGHGDQHANRYADEHCNGDYHTNQHADDYADFHLW